MRSTSWSKEQAAGARGAITAPSPPLTSHQVISLTIDLKARHLSTLFKSSLLDREVVGCKATPHLPNNFFFPGFIQYHHQTLLLLGLLEPFSDPQSEWQGRRQKTLLTAASPVSRPFPTWHSTTSRMIPGPPAAPPFKMPASTVGEVCWGQVGSRALAEPARRAQHMWGCQAAPQVMRPLMPASGGKKEQARPFQLFKQKLDTCR